MGEKKNFFEEYDFGSEEFCFETSENGFGEEKCETVENCKSDVLADSCIFTNFELNWFLNVPKASRGLELKMVLCCYNIRNLLT